MCIELIDRLLQSEHATIRLKVISSLLESPGSTKALRLQKELKACGLIELLLSERDATGKIPHHPYAKWRGAHWVLACLADLGYPPYDKDLMPLLEQVYTWLFSEGHRRAIRAIDGRVRRCASQEGNAIYSAVALGLADERTEALVRSLIAWQWPDGGWNCDKRSQAMNSSFMETLIPLRGLALFARASGEQAARQAADRASEIFLKRQLYRSQRDGSVISNDFLKLHYPCYWHYDILFGLKVMAEGGYLDDPRCRPALHALEAKRLEDGGFPAEARYYHLSEKTTSGRSLVDWGGTSVTRLNEFVTVDALYVLKCAGRLTTDLG